VKSYGKCLKNLPGKNWLQVSQDNSLIFQQFCDISHIAIWAIMSISTSALCTAVENVKSLQIHFADWRRIGVTRFNGHDGQCRLTINWGNVNGMRNVERSACRRQSDETVSKVPFVKLNFTNNFKARLDNYGLHTEPQLSFRSRLQPFSFLPHHLAISVPVQIKFDYYSPPPLLSARILSYITPVHEKWFQHFRGINEDG